MPLPKQLIHISYPFVIQVCSTNCLGDGHVYECHSSHTTPVRQPGDRTAAQAAGQPGSQLRAPSFRLAEGPLAAGGGAAVPLQRQKIARRKSKGAEFVQWIFSGILLWSFTFVISGGVIFCTDARRADPDGPGAASPHSRLSGHPIDQVTNNMTIS